MANYNTNNLVDVRAATTLPWLPGTVTNDACSLHIGDPCWEITLDADCTADDWSGTTRRYGGTALITDKKVHIRKSSDTLGLNEGHYIRTQGG